MAEYSGLSGKSYRTQNTPFAGGGEGDIYDVIDVSGYVAKIYKLDKRTTERERKLSVMVSNQPSVIGQYAWPLDVLYENGQFVGYIMPKINGKEKLRNIYVYDKRKGKPWSLYIAIAKNLSAAVHNVHEIYQVIGDLNPENILVNPRDGMVTLVDTDSYHISDSSRTYRCGVGMPEFVAPELQGVHFPSAPLPTFTPESDRFALAVLIFALLMNGAHPFSCKVISGSSSKFQPIDNMQNGKCAFFPDRRFNNMDIPRYASDLSSLPEKIQKLFRRAFVAGHSTPSLRPSAEEWYNALEKLEDNLKTCLKDTQHIYYYGAKECPWCKVNDKMHSISQSTFNGFSQSGSNSGAGSQPTNANGQAQPFTPSNNQYTPSASSSGIQNFTKNYSRWIVLSATIIVLVLIIRSCTNSDSETSSSFSETDHDLEAHGSDWQDDAKSNTAIEEVTQSTIESGIEVEDNDDYSSANNINVNSIYKGSLQDDYSSGEQDWYVFTLDDPGTITVQFNTEMQGDDGNYWDVSIRSGSNPDNDVWQQYVKGYTTSTESMILALSAGTYYFEVESSNNWATDAYSFKINYESTYGDWEIEDNNTFQKANNIALNTEYNGVLQGDYSSGEQDWYVFTLDDPGTVTVQFNTEMQGDDGNYWDVSIRLGSNPDNDVWQQFVKGYTTSTESMILALSAGTYYFEVESSNNWATDAYSFKINYESTYGDWEIEDNNTFQKANNIALNTEYNGVLQGDYSSGEQDWYVFTLDDPSTVIIQFNTEMQGDDSNYWDISIRSGSNPDNDVWQQFVKGNSTETNETLNLEAGKYYFEVESSNNWAVDAYSFSIIK